MTDTKPLTMRPLGPGRHYAFAPNGDMLLAVRIHRTTVWRLRRVPAGKVRRHADGSVETYRDHCAQHLDTAFDLRSIKQAAARLLHTT